MNWGQSASRSGLESSDLGMEMIGLVPPRHGAGCRRTGKPRGKDRGTHRRSAGRCRRAGATGLIAAETIVPGLEVDRRSKGPASVLVVSLAQHGPRPSIATPSGCWSTCSTLPPRLAQNQVVIDLARRQRKTTGEWGPLRPWYYAAPCRARQV